MRLSRQEILRFLKFSLVGASGVVVNAGMLWLFVEILRMPLYLASLFAIEISIISNFLLNDHWTWRQQRQGSLLSRLLKYNTVTAFSSIFINIAVLLLLKEWFAVPYMLANLTGIAAGMLVNYLFNANWTYGSFKFTLPKSILYIGGISLALRLLLAAGLGAGFDEAYYFSYSIHPDLGYFDHPPIVGFIAGFFPYLTNIVSPLTIRLAVVLLFTVSGFLLFRLAEKLTNTSTAVWAFALFNLTPMFFLNAGIFILPDAGLVFFWLATLSIFQKIFADGAAATWRDWLAAGMTTGFAMLSKYHGVLLGFFLVLYLLVYHRNMFLRVGPYLYGIIAFVVFAPVLYWNAQHQWVSFVFQGSRASSHGLRLDTLLQALAGQAGYLTPMLFFPLFIFLYTLLKKFNQNRFYIFFGLGPVLLFLLISLSRSILPHWTLVGYIALLIPFADILHKAFVEKRWVRNYTWISAAFILLLLTLAFAQTRWGIFRLDKLAAQGVISAKDARMDATLDMIGQPELHDFITGKQLAADSIFFFSHKWFLSSQVDFSLHGAYPVLCFNEKDPRGYGVWDKRADVLGKDAYCVYSNRYRVDAAQKFSPYFRSVGETDSLQVFRNGVYAKTFYFVKFHHLEALYNAPF